MWGSLAILFTVGVAADPSDLKRAQRKVPGDHVIGDGHVGMTVKLNAAIKAMKDVKVKECDEFSIDELNKLQRKLHHARDPALEAIYHKTGDLGRRMGAFGKLSANLEEIEGFWADEAKTLQAYPQFTESSRARKCHEVILWLVHHIPQAVQATLRKQVTLPLLPQREFGDVFGNEGIPENMFPPGGGLGCDQAHAKQSKAKNTEYVEWPEQLTYTATGHGAFPFWDKGGAGCSTCDPSVSGSAQLKVRYSSKQGSEILLHESCGDMTWTGSSGAPKKSPCNHIFTPDLGAFIYTPKTSLEVEADGKFCCRSVKAGSKTFTGAVPRDWMKSGTYAGTYADFKGEHYSGPIKMYTFTGALSFWYYTQPDGTPVQQGEGCEQPGGKKPTACAKEMPIVLYHDFDPATFKNATFTQSDFEVPDVCKTTTVSCAIPGGSTEIIV